MSRLVWITIKNDGFGSFYMDHTNIIDRQLGGAGSGSKVAILIRLSRVVTIAWTVWVEWLEKISSYSIAMVASASSKSARANPCCIRANSRSPTMISPRLTSMSCARQRVTDCGAKSFVQRTVMRPNICHLRLNSCRKDHNFLVFPDDAAGNLAAEPAKVVKLGIRRADLGD